ncbi:maleylpyruvate isomerase family mycothiol-dependent enzyme [Nocardia cyriacigeorgica]|uniref:Maleylpyruvate isomerase family mycothiol-dependent enzyme n=1 Tax=Nocardia cyriacigeorgica TaxID=135487 RepID=A0A6P1D9G7_9NOCA|nr:maleylpyruvate isomerase family mycothiol-dependent enzyme [Nocardia cyriacigeorgica]NEW37445.1 maleylpyruvate isomerase family mycothiol-dependent enzyme [Nocardia cyriacigeorgica]NEW44922.1 maleylpyruvate isomerase family mycothiol-dependent enzyme [Nocardia cyriacigeorgica]NEW49167.1 maleylpyruvate isomerase family mycothiol-dependent enzyme [Nocardia cyriacigeorgica]
MDREQSWWAIEQQRRALAALLGELTDAEWDTPSLCSGWRVREVAAHIALAPQPIGLWSIVREFARARGDYNVLVDTITREHARRPTSELVAEITDHAASRHLPAVTNYRNILFDVMVHGQDISIPLGRPLPIPVEAAAAAATRAYSVGWPVWKRHRLDGFRLHATDTAWTAGEGAEVAGPITALLLLITGRPIALNQLTGPGVDDVAVRLAEHVG